MSGAKWGIIVNVAIDIPFFKKGSLPKFSLDFLSGRPSRVAGIDIGVSSAKVVQLRYEKEKAVLETYGELLVGGYFRGEGNKGGGFMRYSDNEAAELLRDLFKESNISAKDAVFSIPSTVGFTTVISFPLLPREEIEQAIPFEARKYVPIPIAETVIDWDIIEISEEKKSTEVLLIAVSKEVTEKIKRMSALAGINVRAMEIETFCMIRSLLGQDPLPTAVINLGHQSTNLMVVDRGRLRLSHSFDHGSNSLTRALEQGLGVSSERAEAIKREVGLSEKVEEREITSVILPLLDVMFTEFERIIIFYNRKAERKIQRVVITGGGSNLKGVVDLASTKFGIEVSRGNPFARVVTPSFLQPTLREIGSSFAVAVGAALREITIR